MRRAFVVLGAGAILLAIGVFACCFAECIQTIALIIAGAGAILMAKFSMQSKGTAEIKSTSSERKLHDICVMVSFTLVLVSMILLACVPVKIVEQTYPWIRGVALVDFNICALTVVFFVILGYNMRRRLATNDVPPESQSVQHQAPEISGGGQPDAVRDKKRDYVSMFSSLSIRREELKNHGNDAVKTANRGQGVLERILIFMFISWGLMISFVVIAPFLIELWRCIKSWWPAR